VLRELADEAGNYSDEWYPDTGQLEALLDDAEQFADAAPDAVRELADHLIERIERILDFGNCYGDLTEALGRAEDMHLDACLAGSPDPVLLSGRLIEGALDSGWGSFDTALPAYADLLGPDGMARYRELLAQASARGDKISDYTLGILHESLARAEGGTDAVVAMLAQQAGAAHDYVRIAEFLIADGRDDEALTGIARGMEVFPDSVQLPSLALDCHQRAGRRDQTLQMLWRLVCTRSWRPPGPHAAGAGPPTWKRSSTCGWLSNCPTAAVRRRSSRSSWRICELHTLARSCCSRN
jgi:hypothetical protein